jgi:hypothetical protein
VATRCGRKLAGTTVEQVREEYWYGAFSFFLPTLKLKKKKKKKKKTNKQKQKLKSRPESEDTVCCLRNESEISSAQNESVN